MRRTAAAAALTCLVVAGCTSSGHPAASSSHPSNPAPPAHTSSARSTAPASTSDHEPSAAAAVPRFAHIVVVVEENHAASQVIGRSDAPYMNALARTGTVLTASYGIRHPSEPNYLALFSGSTHGLTDDSCPHRYSGDNLGHQLRARGLSFAGYSDSLPSTGYPGCTAGAYARRHVPWTNFTDLPGSVNKPMTAFPSVFTKLPRLAFVIPNVDHDMHDGTVRQADSWLHSHLGAYVTWARSHNSLLVLTWDEDDNTSLNKIPGVLVGAHVRAGHYGNRVDHYTMLRTLEASFGLPALGTAAHRAPITGIWTP